VICQTSTAFQLLVSKGAGDGERSHILFATFGRGPFGAFEKAADARIAKNCAPDTIATDGKWAIEPAGLGCCARLATGR